MEEVKLVSMEATAAQDPACQLHRKRRGEIAELVFMRKAISLGYGVAKPWGESDHYDFILNRGRNFWRIQVKSVWSQIRYRLRASGSNGKTYTINDRFSSRLHQYGRAMVRFPGICARRPPLSPRCSALA